MSVVEKSHIMQLLCSPLNRHGWFSPRTFFPQTEHFVEPDLYSTLRNFFSVVDTGFVYCILISSLLQNLPVAIMSRLCSNSQLRL